MWVSRDTANDGGSRKSAISLKYTALENQLLLETSSSATRDQPAGFQALVQPARDLRRLVACGCTLKHLSLEGHDRLEDVDVSGCNNLESVTLRSPVLTRFAAKHCVNLWVPPPLPPMEDPDI